MTGGTKGFAARLTVFALLILVALPLLGRGVTAHAAEGSGAWGASLPEYAKVKAYDLVQKGKVDNTGTEDCYEGFQKLLDLAKKYTDDTVCVEIDIPNGEYVLKRGLKIYSNTRIICGDDVKIYRCFNGGAILSTAPASAYGYDGARNILIQGGTWDGNAANYGNVTTFSNIRIGHAKNILFRDMNIINNKNGHHIEIGGASGITIDGCTFSGYYGTLMKEAIQLDVMNSESLFAGYSPFDDTACDNVIIRGCGFYDIPRAVGSHSAVAGCYYTNVTIADNTFSGVTNYALFLYNYRRCTIRNNTFSNCGAGILFNHMTDEDFRHFFPSVTGVSGSASRIDRNTDTVIEGNTIDTVVTSLQSFPFAIKLYGANVSATSNYPAADYYMSNIDIRDNKITSAYCGLILNDVYGVTVTGNEIEGKADGAGGYLISANWCYDSSFKNNTLSEGVKSGFCAQNSAGLTAEGNTIRSCGDVAMLLSAVSDSTVGKSGFTDCGLGGVKIDDASSSITLSGNVIRGGNYAVKVDSSGGGKDIKIKNNDISASEVGVTFANGGMAYLVGNSFEAVGRKISAETVGQVTLSKPRSFYVEEVTSDNIKLTWTAVGEADGINVYRKRAGGEYALIATGDSGSIFLDEMLDPGTNYVYKVVPFLIINDESAENTPSDELAARTKVSLDDVQIICAEQAGFTGRPIEPSFGVSYGGRELIPGVDYEYSYADNLGAGTATLTVTGRGNFIGTQTVGFVIALDAVPLAQTAPKISGLAGMEEKKHCEVTVERQPEELLAVSDEIVNPIQRQLDALTIDQPVKITASESVWGGSGYIYF